MAPLTHSSPPPTSPPLSGLSASAIQLDEEEEDANNEDNDGKAALGGESHVDQAVADADRLARLHLQVH